MAKQEFIAFIDLVGVKDVHADNPNLYADKISDFQSILEHYIEKLDSNQEPGKDCQVFIFSDCAFIRSEKLTNLIDYLRWVRYLCYTSSRILFFKGAIVKGTLTAKESENRSKSLRGVTFSKDAVTAYVKHEQSKAIGIVIDENVKKLMRKSDFVINFSFTSERSDAYDTFYDLTHCVDSTHFQRQRSTVRYQGVSFDIANHCLAEFYRASLKSKKLARYYPPIFSNWLQSVSLRKIFSKKNSQYSSAQLSKDSESPWGVYAMVCSKEFVKDFWTIPGVPCLYLVILNKIYTEFLDTVNDNADHRNLDRTIPLAIRETQEFIFELPGLSKILSNAPTKLLSAKCRDLFLNDFVSRRISGSKPN